MTLKNRGITPGAGGGVDLAQHFLAVRADPASDLSQFNGWLGSSADMAIQFAESNNGATTWAQNLTTVQQIASAWAGVNVRHDWAFSGCSTTQPMSETIAGTHDAIIRQVLQAIADFDKNDVIPLRLMWEPGFTTAYPWSASSAAGKAAEYIACFRRIAGIIRSVSSRFRIIWCLTTTTTDYTGAEFNNETCYPGDDVVDIIGMDVYSITPGVPAAQDFRTKRIGTYGIDWAYAFAVAHGKPFSINEYGVNYDGPAFHEGMAEYCRDRAITHLGIWNKNVSGAPNFQDRLSDDQYPLSSAEFKRQHGPLSILTPAVFTAPTGSTLDLELEGNKRGKWSVVGGADASAFQIIGTQTLRSTPLAARAYAVILRLTDERGQSVDRACIITGAAGSVLPEAQFYAARCTTAPSTALLAAISQYIAALKAADVWKTRDLIYLLLNETEQAARLNLKTSRNTLTALNAPTFTAKAGYKGNAGNARLLSGFIPSLPGRNCLQDNLRLGVHSLTNVNPASGNSAEAGADSALMVGKNSTGQVIGRPNQSSTVTLAAVDAFPGYVGSQRIGPMSSEAFSGPAGSRVRTTTSVASAHFLHQEFMLLGANTATGGSNSLAVVDLGSTVTAAQDAAMAAATAAFVTAATA